MDENCEALKYYLERNSYIEILSLNNNCVTDLGGDKIMCGLFANKSIK